jgi:hypothetical protein
VKSRSDAGQRHNARPGRMTYITEETKEIHDLIKNITRLVDKAKGPEAFRLLIDDVSSLEKGLKSAANS